MLGSMQAFAMPTEQPKPSSPSLSQPTTPIELLTTTLGYYQEIVTDPNDNRFRVMTCGENHFKNKPHLFKQLRHAFDSISSYDSDDIDYNQTAFLLEHPEKTRSCVDNRILNDNDSGYTSKGLKHTVFYGLIKTRETGSGSIHYIPFKTKPVGKQWRMGDKKTIYELKIQKIISHKSKSITVFKEEHYYRVMVKWLAERHANQEQMRELKDDPGIPILHKSRLYLTLIDSDNFGRKTYAGQLSGDLRLPWNQNTTIKLASAPDIRFPKPGYNNFRKDIRYKKSISFIPDPNTETQNARLTEAETEVIEIILLPPRESKKRPVNRLQITQVWP